MEANKFLQEGTGVITLCGSTQYFFEAMEANRQLTFQNWIVLMCGSWGHSFHKFVENINTDYTEVKRLHFHKIAMSDAIVVVYNKSQYIGQSTEKEIHFVRHIGIPVFFFDGERFFGSTETKPPLRQGYRIELVAGFEEQYGLGC